MLGQLDPAAVKYLVIPSVENVGKGTRKLCSMRTETREECYGKKPAFSWEYGRPDPPDRNSGKAGVVGKWHGPSRETVN